MPPTYYNRRLTCLTVVKHNLCIGADVPMALKVRKSLAHTSNRVKRHLPHIVINNVRTPPLTPKP